MAEKINIVGKQAERIQDTGHTLPRIEPSEFAAALGAEPCGERLTGDLDPISLAELGTELIKRLRSTGGRPALADATRSCKVPLSPEDIEALEQIISDIEHATGTRPSLGQIASVILRMHLETLKKTAEKQSTKKSSDQTQNPLPCETASQEKFTVEPLGNYSFTGSQPALIPRFGGGCFFTKA